MFFSTRPDMRAFTIALCLFVAHTLTGAGGIAASETGEATALAPMKLAQADDAPDDDIEPDDVPVFDDEMDPPLAAPPMDGDRLLLEGLGPMLEAERAIQQELEIGPRPSFPLKMQALLTEQGERVEGGLVWRVFRAEPHSNGAFELVEESQSAEPSFLLPADEYIIHVAYGLANAAKRVSLAGGPVVEEITLDAGGLRVTGVDSEGQDLPERLLSLSIYSSEEEEYGQRRQLLERAAPGRVIRLNPGTYHIVSRFGDANAIIRADVQVKSGELTDAEIQHRAAAITFKLVNEPGGEALADTSWTILTPGGDTVKESSGAFPTHVLVEGSYALIARHNGRMFNRDFDVVSGIDREIELVAR